MTTTLESVLTRSSLDISALASSLDAMDSHSRLSAVRSMNARAQARIWAACEGRGSQLADLVPDSVATSVEVVHSGKNSLPMFSHFEKRFCRVDGRLDRLYGYNEGATRNIVGPGYFVAFHYPERDEVGINYYEVPPDDARLPAGWPAIKGNEDGLQRFVYSRMIDYMRKVSHHVSIGRATRNGKETANYFLLCRND